MLNDISSITIDFDTADEQGKAAANGLRLMGFSIQESAGGPDAAALYLRHGTDDTGPVMFAVTLAASESKTQWFGPQGLNCEDGIFLERTAGESTVTLLTATL